jgi:hypothetical protein
MRVLRRLVDKAKTARPADDVARVVEKALTARRPRAAYYVGGDARFRMLFELLPARVRDAIIVARLRRM